MARASIGGALVAAVAITTAATPQMPPPAPPLPSPRPSAPPPRLPAGGRRRRRRLHRRLPRPRVSDRERRRRRGPGPAPRHVGASALPPETPRRRLAPVRSRTCRTMCCLICIFGAVAACWWQRAGATTSHPSRSSHLPTPDEATCHRLIAQRRAARRATPSASCRAASSPAASGQPLLANSCASARCAWMGRSPAPTRAARSTLAPGTPQGGGDTGFSERFRLPSPPPGQPPAPPPPAALPPASPAEAPRSARRRRRARARRRGGGRGEQCRRRRASRRRVRASSDATRRSLPS